MTRRSRSTSVLWAALALAAAWPAAARAEDHYVLATKDGQSMSGGDGDLSAATAAAKRAGATVPYLWYRHDGAEHVITDAATLAPFLSIAAEQMRLGAVQHQLAQQQRPLGDQQAALAGKMAKLAHALEKAAKRGERTSEMEQQIDVLGRQQEQLGARQAALGSRQAELGRRQAALAHELQQKLARLVAAPSRP